MVVDQGAPIIPYAVADLIAPSDAFQAYVALAGAVIRGLFMPNPLADCILHLQPKSLIWQRQVIGGERASSELYHPLP